MMYSIDLYIKIWATQYVDMIFSEWIGNVIVSRNHLWTCGSIWMIIMILHVGICENRYL